MVTSWEQLLPELLVAAGIFIGAVVLLIKTVTSTYGKVVSMQTETIDALTLQNKGLQRQMDTEHKQIRKLHRLRRRDRKKCQEEMQALKNDLMGQIHQCPVLMGEVGPNQTCPYRTAERGKDHMLPPEGPTVDKEQKHDSSSRSNISLLDSFNPIL